jgi:hypothetical protein
MTANGITLLLFLAVAFLGASVEGLQINVAAKDFEEKIINDSKVWLVGAHLIITSLPLHPKDTFTNLPNFLLQEFYSAMCGSCKEFTPTWDQLNKSLHRNVNTAKINIDEPEGMQVAQNLGVLGRNNSTFAFAFLQAAACCDTVHSYHNSDCFLHWPAQLCVLHCFLFKSTCFVGHPKSSHSFCYDFFNKSVPSSIDLRTYFSAHIFTTKFRRRHSSCGAVQATGRGHGEHHGWRH